MQVSLQQGAKICDHGALGYSVARCTHTRKHYPFRGRKQFKPSWFKLFPLRFSRIFSQLPANGSSRNNCSIEKLINFADGVIFNRLICTTLRFFHLLQEAFFRSTTKFSLPISKSFHKNVQENSVKRNSAFWQDYQVYSYVRFNFSKLHLNLGRYQVTLDLF